MVPTRSRVPNTSRFASALVATNLKASLALRGAFALQAAFMLLNNVTFFIVWVLFFHRFESIGGWELGDVGLLFGVAAAGFGVSVVLAGGLDRLSAAILDGDLDPVLVQPKHPLLQELGSRSRASGWGDIATGAVFLAIEGALWSERLPLALGAILASAAVFTAAGVLFHSAAFWLGRVETLARQAHEFTLTFSLYPQPLFGGTVRILLFTAIPAGFVSYLPVEVVRSPDPLAFAAAIAGAAAFTLLALGVFALGLRQYESGNRFGVRG